MRLATAVIAVAALGAVPFASSHAQRGVAAPRITVQQVEPLPVSAGQQRFRVTLLVDNINTEPLKLKAIDFKLRLADQGIIDGRTGPLVIEALDRQTVTLDVGSEIVSSVSRLLSFVQGPKNTLPYEIYGTVELERRFREPLPFSANGEVPLVMTGER
jgi:LEA14-like dessication related protein